MPLSVRDIQSLLASASVYTGRLDGDAGPLTHLAVKTVLDRKEGQNSKKMTGRRRLVAAAQLILKTNGFDPGVIDGYDGYATSSAFDAWQRTHGHKPRTRPVTSSLIDLEHPNSAQWPTQKNVENFFGPVGQNQTHIDLPYPLQLSWKPGSKINRIMCHEKIAEPLTTIFTQVLKTYSLDNIKKLNLDQFGGCLNVRKIRGGQHYSMHSWGIAVDMDPIHNQFRWGRDRAAFARPEYDDFWNIVENTGAISLGRMRNFDWMHFQFARLDTTKTIS